MSRGEEKGTDPRRKLEREMKLAGITSRRVLIERERAMEAARNPGVSKFGDCLFNANQKSDKLLKSNLRKISSEIRRMELQINQKMKYFVKTSNVLNHDPIILVERPPSPEVKKRAQAMKYYEGENDVPGDENKPGYMKQLRTKARTPSTLTTIDAFTVKQRKKKNVWDLNEKSGPDFQSTVRPCAKLTRREVSDLQKGYEFHKPKIETSSASGLSDTEEQGTPKTKRKKKQVKEVSTDESGESDIDDEMTPFITQMAKIRSKSQERKEKTLPEFAVSSSHTDSPVTEAESGGKVVRFMSPVIMSAPRQRTHGRKLKTTETEVTY